MKSNSILRPAVTLLILMTVITGIAYPLVVAGVAKVLFSREAGGSLIVKDGKPVGSRRIGQLSSDPRYVGSRPSGLASFWAARTGLTLSASPRRRVE